MDASFRPHRPAAAREAEQTGRAPERAAAAARERVERRLASTLAREIITALRKGLLSPDQAFANLLALGRTEPLA